MNEKDLLRQLKTNDQQAFAQVYQLYWESLYVTACRVLRSPDDAADAVQEVFLALWNRRQELDIQTSLEGYLHTSVKYKAIHFIEKNITRQDYLAMLTETSLYATGDDPDSFVALKELHTVVSNVVAGMPPKMQQAYRLSREKNLSHKEIAAEMDISPETVKKHIQHALEMIKIAIQDHGLTIAGLTITQLF